MTSPDMPLDQRLNIFRADLADERLRGKVEAQRYVTGTPASVILPVIGLRPKPELECGIDTELLLGETVLVFDRANGWAWVQADADGGRGELLTGDDAARPTTCAFLPKRPALPP